ncbi:MAG: hypothetical protein QG657_473 [Acidobacteriota bacterium]|nr:hypothetical protein [Acidobacteriota bacterium]
MVKKTKEIKEETKPSEDFGLIQRLIRKEEEVAMTFFQGRDFNAEVKERIRMESRKKITLPDWFRFPAPIPALGAALLVLLAAVLAVIYLFSPPTQPAPGDDFKQLERIFAQVQLPKHGQMVSTAPHSLEYQALEWRFKQVLYSVYMRDENISETALPHIFNKVLYNVPMPEEQGIDFGKSDPLNSHTLEKRIQTMIKEKQLYRTFKNVLDT